MPYEIVMIWLWNRLALDCCLLKLYRLFFLSQKALSRKGSCRLERQDGEEQDADVATKRFVEGMECVCGSSSCYLEQSGLTCNWHEN